MANEDVYSIRVTHAQTKCLRASENNVNLVPRAHVSFGQRRDTELWNNPFLESKILGLPVSQRMRSLA